jgi:hypothetical protein
VRPLGAEGFSVSGQRVEKAESLSPERRRMVKFVSYAYRPQGDAESRRKEMETLRRGFSLILRNLDRILRTPRFFFCQLQSAYSWTFWFGPSGPIPLGVLVLLWENGKMIHGCTECGGRLYAVGVGGSFSRGDVWGLCVDCGYNGKFMSRSWHPAFFAVSRLLPLYKNEPIIEYGKQPRFDWKYGLVGEPTPDKVLVPAVEPVDLTALLDELETAEAGAVIPYEGAEPVPPRKPDGPTVFLQIQKGQGVLKMPVSLPNARAFEIVRIATGESVLSEELAKNPHAVALGKTGGAKGGKALTASMTKKQRSEAARLAPPNVGAAARLDPYCFPPSVEVGLLKMEVRQVDGTDWNQEPEVFEGAGAIAKLSALDLNQQAVVMAVENSEIERLGCSVFEPRLVPGIKAWAAAFRTMAEDVVPRGWRKIEARNLPRLVNDDLHIALAVISGNEATGLKHRTPKSKTPRGEQSLSFVRFNQVQGILFPDLALPETADEYLTYWLLIFSDGKGTRRAELSLPMDIDAEYRLCAWRERVLITLPEPEPTRGKLPEDEEPPLDIEVVVKPKS